MLIRPELRALRGDAAPQRLAQAALGAALAKWRRAMPIDGLEQEVDRFGAGEPIADLPLLTALFTPGSDAAERLIAGLVQPLAQALAEHPLGQVPLCHYSDETISTLILASSPGASLMLQGIDSAGLARQAAPLSASFSPTESWDRVLAGRAGIERIRLCGEAEGRAELHVTPAAFEPGAVDHRIAAQEALRIVTVEGALVSLRLQRRIGQHGVTREYLLADGTLIHQAAGAQRDSRLELAAVLLGRMGRHDAAPLLAALAEEQGALSLRWQALRECLGLDSGAGFAVLARLAARPDDPLAAPAEALRLQLLKAYPQLAGAAPCPA